MICLWTRQTIKWWENILLLADRETVNQTSNNLDQVLVYFHAWKMEGWLASHWDNLQEDSSVASSSPSN